MTKMTAEKVGLVSNLGAFKQQRIVRTSNIKQLWVKIKPTEGAQV